MRRDNKANPFEAKRIARQKYAERQIDKWWQWSWEARGKIKYKETVLEGIEKAPQGLRDVLSGKNFGKQLIKVSD